MNLFGKKEKVVPAPKRRSRNKPSMWMRAATKTSDPLLQKIRDTSPTMQAAIISKITGVPFTKEDIPISDPLKAMEARVTEAAMKDIENDEDFIESYKDGMLENLYTKSGAGRRRMFRRGRGDGQEFEGMGSPAYGGFDPTNPLAMFDLVDQLKERIGGGSAIDKLANSTVLSDIVKVVIPALMGGKGGQQNVPQIAPRPAMVAVEVDGQLVEMTRQGYEIYKKQREQLLLQGGGKVAEPPPRRPPAPPNTGTKPPKEEVPATDVEQPLSDNAEEAPSLILPESVIQTLVEVAKRFEAGMNLPPEKFVQDLYEESLTDTDSAVIFSALAKVADYDDALAKASNFKHYPDLLPFITKLEANRPWATAVLAKVKELTEEK